MKKESDVMIIDVLRSIREKLTKKNKIEHHDLETKSRRNQYKFSEYECDEPYDRKNQWINHLEGRLRGRE